jgi:hypothetical protein
MEEQSPIAEVIRVLRYDTIQIRVWLPLAQMRAVCYITPAGVWCDCPAKEAIVDWCELHANHDRLFLVTYDNMRDEYGRLIADLADTQSGDRLSSYLVQVGAAKPRPHHLLDAFGTMLQAGEVDDVIG